MKLISKPFFNRLKSPPPEPPKDPPPSSEKLLLKMLHFAFKLENNESTLLKIARTLSLNLNIDTVCISEITNNEIHLRQTFHHGNELTPKKQKWVISSSDPEITNKKQELYCDEIKIAVINTILPNKTITATSYCIPSINEDNTSAAFINLFHSSQRSYSHCENEILKLMAQRITLFFQHEQQMKIAPSIAHHNDDELAQTLKQTQEELEATNKSLKSLSFSVSHELRAPLRCMDSFSKALVEDFSDNLPAEALDNITRIRKACTRMGQMIDDLLWLARVSRGKIEQENIDLSKLTKKVANKLIETENIPNITLTIQPNLFVIADASLLKIAIKHLLSNAIKFSRLNESISIELFAEQKENSLIFAIRDNGQGFDMAYYEQLFEPFKQLHSSSKFNGTGIGLATVERIIVRHQGKIWAESDIGEGATFYFTLPPNK